MQSNSSGPLQENPLTPFPEEMPAPPHKQQTPKSVYHETTELSNIYACKADVNNTRPTDTMPRIVESLTPQVDIDLTCPGNARTV